MSTTLTIIGWIVTVITSWGGAVFYVSRFIGRTETKDKVTEDDLKQIKQSIEQIKDSKASVKDIQEIKESLTKIFDLIREGALHPTCLQLGAIGALQTQAQANSKRLDRMDEEILELQRNMHKFVFKQQGE